MHRQLYKAVFSLFALLIVAISGHSVAQQTIDRDTLVAIYLLRFTENLEWDDKQANEPIRFLVLENESNIATRLSNTPGQTNSLGQRITVATAASAEVNGDYDLVYLAAEYNEQLSSILRQVQNKATLVVTDGSENQRLVMINLIQQTDGRISFEINRANIINQGLSISADLILLGGTEIDVARLYQEGLSELQQQEQRLNQLQEESASLQQQLALERQNSDRLTEQLSSLYQEIGELNVRTLEAREELEVVSQNLAQQSTKLEEQQIEIDLKTQQLDAQQNNLDRLQNSIAQRERELQSQETMIENRSEVIKQQDLEIEQQLNVLAQRDQTISMQRQFLFYAALAIVLFLGMAVVILRSYAAKQKTLKELEDTTEALRQAKAQSEQASRSKSQFLSNMSHELRTPLNAILGYTQLLEANPPSPERLQKDLRTINNSGEHLLSLINDVLDMSKIEAGVAKLKEEDFDLEAQLNDLIDMMRIRAEAKGLQLEWVPTNQFPKHVRCDLSKLKQILINLVGNAIKFTEVGKVSLTLTPRDTDKPDERILVFCVSDTGIGIPKDKQDSIFTPFEQVESSLLANTGQKGTGLGMTITKKFIDLMGGMIELESEPGVGSRFYFSIPVSISDRKVTAAKGITEQVIGIQNLKVPLKILIAEDQKDSANLLERMLIEIGANAKVAKNGQEAVAIFQAWQPDFIWMDRHMPILDGIEATKAIRALPGGHKVKIVALTAAALDEERVEALNAGCDDFVSKPFKTPTIYKVMQKLLGIEYKFRHQSNEAKLDEQKAKVIDTDKLKSLEADLLSELEAAALELSKTKVILVADKIAKIDNELALQLTYSAEHFEFERLLAIIDELTKV